MLWTTWPTQCLICRWRRESISGRRPACDAFPDGIPEALWVEAALHDREWPGDGGLRFEEDAELWDVGVRGGFYEQPFYRMLRASENRG